MNRQNITSLTFFYPTQYQYLVMMKMAQIKTHNLSHGSNKLLVLQLLRCYWLVQFVKDGAWNSPIQVFHKKLSKISKEVGKHT